MSQGAAVKDHQSQASVSLQGGHRRQQRPLGSPTRGKTAPGRLRQLDTLALLYAPHLLRPRLGPAADAPYVDLGYGASPDTTLESAERFRQLDPRLPIVGYEIDRERVLAARFAENSRTRFRLGGFDFRPETFGADDRPHPARLIRAFNVLRQYDEPSAQPAVQRLVERIEIGGLLIEGSSDPSGRLWAAQLVRAYHQGPRLEALAFGIPRWPEFTPADLRAVLPKRFVHRVTPDTILHRFFERWEREWRGAGDRDRWARLGASVQGLRDLHAPGSQAIGFHVDPRRRWARRGIVIWRCPMDGLKDEDV